MKDLNDSGIYIIENTVNHKKYLGSSKNIKNRIKKHFELLKRNKHHSIYLQNSYNKYGKKFFKYYLLEKCTINKLLIIEQKHLDKIKNWKNSFNMSKIARGCSYNINNHPNGIKIRKKIGEANKGRGSKPFFIDNIKYNTLKDASIKHNVDIKTISYRIKNWKYKDYYYIDKPKEGEFVNNKYDCYWYKPKYKKKKYYCNCGVVIGKYGKFCKECINKRRDNKKHINPITINNIEYISPKEASILINIKYETLIYRINSNTKTYMNYYYSNKPKNLNDLLTPKDIQEKIFNKRNNNKSFFINNIKYFSLSVASKYLNIPPTTIRKRLLSKNFKNYIYE